MASFWWLTRLNRKNQLHMLYTLERYPSEMNKLPEEVRRKAIKITNDMMNDGDVRYHKDYIIVVAIEKAKRLEMGKNKPQATG